jgi:hypothetical protein
VIRLLRKRRVVVAGALLLCVLTASAYGAHRVMDRTHRTYALYQFAQNPPWFKAALKRVHLRGGTISLPAGRVAPLQLFDLTPSAPIRLVGKPSTRLSGISIKRSKSIVVSNARMTPAGQPAIADVSASSDITFRGVRFLGSGEDMGVALQLDPDDRDVTVAQAEFAHCQHGLACILAQGSGLVIDHVRFHDVRDADVIRGAADDVTISDSDLHDALAGTHADNHNDLIQILGGGPWTIARSHFGVRSNGAAQVYVDPRSGPAGPVHDVHVESSLFTGSNKDMFFAINVRDPAQSSVPLATGVEFVNNTIVSANIAAIVLADEYAKVPSDQRPLVQNNILGRQKHSLCGVARVVTNVIGSGASCPGDRRGTPSLDGKGRPAAASASLLAHGTSDGAPATDLNGHKRGDPPTIGAVELVPGE